MRGLVQGWAIHQEVDGMNRDSWDQPGILIHLLAGVTTIFKGHAMLCAMLCDRHLYRDRYLFGGYRDGTLCAYMHVAARTVEKKKACSTTASAEAK